MICLGVESTAHTFGVSVATREKILSNVMNSYKPKKGGIHPREASEHHARVCTGVINESLSKAGLSHKDLDLIAFSNAPGIGHTLGVGAVVARTLSKTLDKPLIPVNHCIAHVEIGRRITGCIDPVTLYVSGANTQIIAYQGGYYRVFAETLDMGAGNFIDSFARYSGIPFPGGPVIEKLAEKGGYVELPYSVKGMDVSFTGILTNLRNKLRTHELKDLCYSMQEHVFAMLVEVSERALAHCQKNELLLAGGVASNKRLREMCKVMCKERGAEFFVPKKEYCVDNGAMIAVLGLLMHDAGVKLKKSDYLISQRQRTDEVMVLWR